MSLARIIAPLLDNFHRRRRANGLMRQANAFYQKGSFSEAAEIYRQAVNVEPNRAVLRFNLGLALYKSGRKREGRAEWEQVRELAKGTNAYMLEQAEIMLRQFS